MLDCSKLKKFYGYLYAFRFCFGGSEFPSPILRDAVRVLDEYDVSTLAASYSQQRQRKCHTAKMLHTIAKLAVLYVFLLYK